MAGLTGASSKIVAARRVSELLPAGYQWTLPVPGVEPVSCGLPCLGEDGPCRDQQWRLMKENFRGKWQGPTMWYERSDDCQS